MKNCAVVAITGSATTYVGPGAFRANTGSCVTDEGYDPVFPNPGSQVSMVKRPGPSRPKYVQLCKSDPQTPEANKDYRSADTTYSSGSDWPCKKRGTKEIADALKPVATLVSGQTFKWELGDGGSCQVGMSYDWMETTVVMASYIGGCPLSTSYEFTVPEMPASDKALFWWAWYQNCAVVAVTGSADTFVGPQAFRANTGSCVTDEGYDPVFPNPGSQVIYGGGGSTGKGAGSGVATGTRVVFKWGHVII
ncbi:hypothetical protein MNV49_006417 [Pseudohyphozyma bogoriensis]|nr:hypothetical protein MNV49_006417 [Pseudohyphozyma bogoriensis]